MEEFDDLVPTPDKDGYLELSYRGWKVVDEVIWTMGRELIHLNLSFNSLTALAPELGDLQVLRELNISCNQIESLPKQIGKLKMLRVFKMNSNRVQVLPEELCACSRLTHLYAGENRLLNIPKSIKNLKDLAVLQLCNNSLSNLPGSLSSLKKLKELDISNNIELNPIIPTDFQTHASFILWMCQMLHDYDTQVEMIQRTDEGYRALLDRTKRAKKDLIGKVEQVNDDRKDLLEDFPTGCDARCSRCYSACRCQYCCTSGCSVM